jgi:putative ABC transport system permease protein
MILGIALGVAVVAAIDLANASARKAFELSTDAVVGRATHQIAAGPTGLDETVYFDLKRNGLLVPAAPVISAFVSSSQLGDVPLQLLGIDPLAEAPFRNFLANAPGQNSGEAFSRLMTEPGAIMISRGLAETHGLAVNDTIELLTAGLSRQAYIVGLIESDDPLNERALEGLMLADIATAQELGGLLGKISHVDLIIPPGFEHVAAEIADVLPVGTQIQPVAARGNTVEQMSSAFQLNLSALSLLALVVGIFLIYNTMTFSIIQRRQFFGTLRCLGITRAEVIRLVMIEALVVGLLGSALGLAGGLLLAQQTIQTVTETISDLFFVVTVRSASISPVSLVKAFTAGVGATLFAAIAPAREAARTSPKSALSRATLEIKAVRSVRTGAWVGAGGVLLSLGLLSLPGESLVLGFAATFGIVLSLALLTPVTTRAIMRLLEPLTSRLGSVIIRMAPRNVTAALSRTSVAIAALMVAVSVTIGIGVMIDSFRFTVEVWLGQTLQGDIYISPPGLQSTRSGGLLLDDSIEQLRDWPDVERLDLIRSVEVISNLGPVTLAATNNPNSGAERIFKASSGTEQVVWQAMQQGHVIISEPLAVRLGYGSLETLDPDRPIAIVLDTPSGEAAFPISAIFFDYASTQGIVLMDLDTYQQIWGDSAINGAALRLATGADPDQISRDIQVQLSEVQALSVQPNQSLRAQALEIFDRTFAITSSLQVLATIVAFIGVLSALMSLQIEKRAELATLRAIGFTAGQMWRLTFVETGLMGLSAGLLALPTGLVLSLILIQIINKRAFGWTLQTDIMSAPFISAVGVALLAALLAGVLPSWQLGRLSIARAMKRE